MIKFSCEKVFLQNAIAVTSRAVAQKSSIPALEGLLIHADQQLTISGYNMQTGIRTNVFANVVEGGDIVLNARLFGDIIRRMPDDMITFTADEKMILPGDGVPLSSPWRARRTSFIWYCLYG